MRGLKLGGPVLMPGIDGMIVGVNFNVIRGSIRGGLIRRLTTVANRRPLLYHTHGDISGFGLHRNVMVNTGTALHNRGVCRFLSHLFGIALPHVHSFHNLPGENFSKHNGCAFNLGSRAAFPRVSTARMPTRGNVSVAVYAANSSGATHRLLALLNLPFTNGGGGGWKSAS